MMRGLVRQLVRCVHSNGSSESTSIYGSGPTAKSSAIQRVTLTKLRHKHARGEPITMVTAYNYPSAVHVSQAKIDMCLIGDSAAMVVHGHSTTMPVPLKLMLVHCQAVGRGAAYPFLVGDLPFGSYEASSTQTPLSFFIQLVRHWPLLPAAYSAGSSSRESCAQIIDFAFEFGSCFGTIMSLDMNVGAVIDLNTEANVRSNDALVFVTSGGVNGNGNEIGKDISESVINFGSMDTPALVGTDGGSTSTSNSFWY